MGCDCFWAENLESIISWPFWSSLLQEITAVDLLHLKLLFIPLESCIGQQQQAHDLIFLLQNLPLGRIWAAVQRGVGQGHAVSFAWANRRKVLSAKNPLCWVTKHLMAPLECNRRLGFFSLFFTNVDSVWLLYFIWTTSQCRITGCKTLKDLASRSDF